MSDFFEDILQISDVDLNQQFLELLNRSLPQYRFSILLKNGKRLQSSHQDIIIDRALEKQLRKDTDTSKPLLSSVSQGEINLYTYHLEEMNSLLVCEIPSDLDQKTASAMLKDTLGLCVNIFQKDRLLAEEKELLLAHKKQRDGKIQVLEKKYQEILTRNQTQSAEYSKLLNSEIQRQTSELKMSNKALTRAKEKAEAANIAKDKFLANMSHEIRTPMNGVVGMIEMLLGTTLSEEQQHFILLMKNSSEALLNVINDILDYSKIEAGKLDIEEIQFDLRKVFEEISDIITINVFEKGLSFACILDSDVPTRIIGDPVRLRQIMMNFCGNAIKFTKKGEIIIHVSLADETPKTVTLKFQVSDTGIGIPSDRIEDLFLSFSQLDTGMTRKYGGTGLGLAISKQLAQLMGGDIGVESAEKKGSTFWLTLDFQKQAKQKTVPVPDTLKKAPILIADSNSASRRVIIEYLKMLECPWEEADNGTDALNKIMDAFEHGTPHQYIFIDQDLPLLHPDELISLVSEKIELSDTFFVILFSIGNKKKNRHFLPAHNIISLSKPVKYESFMACMGLIDPDSANKATDARKGTRQGEKHIEKPFHGQYRVLLAEDDEMNQIVVVNLLKQFNIGDIRIVENGKQAVEMFCSGNFDLILMDGQMPVMSGLEAAAIIRTFEKENRLDPIPIIALTAHAMKQDRELFINSGMDDYLTKPINSRSFLACIKSVLKKRSSASPGTKITPSKGGDGVVDKADLKKILCGKKPLLEKCIRTFTANYPPLLDRIIHDVDHGEYDSLKKNAHKIKGMLSYLAAHNAVEAAAYLEKTGAEQTNLSQADKHVSLLKKSYNDILQCLESILKNGF